MEFFYVIGFIAFIRVVIAQVEKRQAAITTLAAQHAQSACMTCAYAHIAHGFSQRQKLIACTFGGSVRKLKFAVSACTFYFNREAIPHTVRVVGFAEQTESPEAVIAAKSTQ